MRIETAPIDRAWVFSQQFKAVASPGVFGRHRGLDVLRRPYAAIDLVRLNFTPPRCGLPEDTFRNAVARPTEAPTAVCDAASKPRAKCTGRRSTINVIVGKQASKWLEGLGIVSSDPLLVI